MKPTKKALTTSIAIGRALQQSSYNAPLKLNLETDFYDPTPTAGLHSESVWHNTLMGMQRKLADSLYVHSWDGFSFRWRTWSGNWDH
jgi:hypothetical protein